MSDRLTALREKRNALAIEVNQLVNAEDYEASRDLPIWHAKSAELNDLDDRIKAIHESNKRLAEENADFDVLDAGARAARNKGDATAPLFAKFLTQGLEKFTPEELQAYNTLIQSAMVEGTPSAGGYTVPTDVATEVIDALKWYGGMREAAEVFNTGNGAPISYPQSNGTSETGAWLAEGATGGSADISFAQVTIPVYWATSLLITVSWDLLMDSVVDIEGLIKRRIATRLGRITNTGYTSGSGSGQPSGLVGALGVGKAGAAGQLTSVLYTDLVALEHSVDRAYRSNPGARWMMHDDTLRGLRVLLDGQGRPIFAPGYTYSLPVGGQAGGEPDRLLGKPVTINNDMPTMAANAKSIAFGDLTNYKIRDVMSVGIQRYTDSTFTRARLVGFEGFMRTGGAYTDIGGSAKLFQHAAS